MAIAQQHVAVGARPYEARERIAMKCKAITQGAIRTWETEEKNGRGPHTVDVSGEELSCF